MSITKLTSGFHVTRQAITKHLRVMGEAGLIHSARRGHKRVWQLEQERLRSAGGYLDLISKQWDEALGRLREFIEKG